MKRRFFSGQCVGVGCLCVLVAASGCSSPGLRAELMDVETRFIQGYNAKDMDAMNRVLHADESVLASMTSRVDLKARCRPARRTNDTVMVELRAFRLLGTDGDAAFVRVGLHAEGRISPTGRLLRPDIDALHVFRKEEGRWLLWTDTVLELVDPGHT